MNNVRLFAALGLVLAVSGMAAASSIPMGGTGAVLMHLSNYDDALVYDYNNGFLADNTTPIVLGTAYPAAQVKVGFGGIALQQGESSWGVFKIDQGLAAAITGPNTITPAGSDILYSDGDAGLELVGIFYGRSDVSVTFSVDPISGDNTQVIRTTGDKFEIFTQPTGTYDDGNAGAVARAAVNEYPGVGYDGSGTNTLVPGAQLVLTGETQGGIVSYAGISVFTPSGISTGSGTFEQFISLGTLPNGMTGSDNVWWDNNIFPCGGAVATVANTTADFRLQGTTSPTNKPWVVSSSDPLTAAFVPEPLTVLGVLMAAGSIGGYIRKRRNG